MFAMITAIFLIDDFLKAKAGVDCDCADHYMCPKIHVHDYIRLSQMFAYECYNRGFNYLANSDLRDFVMEIHVSRVNRLS